MSGKARNSVGQAAGTSCCLQTVTGMKDLCALVLGLKPQGCASTASVAVLDAATHIKKKKNARMQAGKLHVHADTRNTCSVLCLCFYL